MLVSERCKTASMFALDRSTIIPTASVGMAPEFNIPQESETLRPPRYVPFLGLIFPFTSAYW